MLGVLISSFWQHCQGGTDDVVRAQVPGEVANMYTASGMRHSQDNRQGHSDPEA